MRASTEPPEDPPAEWRGYASLLAVLTLGLLLIRYRFDLAVPDGWSLAPDPARHPYPPARLLPALLVMFSGGGLTWWLVRTHTELSRGRTAAALTVLTTTCVGLQLTCDWGSGPDAWLDNAVASTWSTISNGYLLEATRVEGPRELMREYAGIQAANDKKLGTHPPGAVLLYRLGLDLFQTVPPLQVLMLDVVDLHPGGVWDIWSVARQAPNVPREFEPSDVPATLWCLIFVALLGALGVVPCYLLGAVDGHRRTGLLAAALLAVAPNVIFYYLSLDVVLMSLSAWALCGAVYAVRGEKLALGPALGAGLALGLAGLISLGAAAPAMLAIGYLVLAAAVRHVSWKQALSAAALVVLGVALVLGIATAMGLATATVYRTALAMHKAGGGGIGHRHYLPWLPFNLIDYAVFVGLPIIFVVIEGGSARSLAGRTAPVLLAATVVTLLVLNFSGTVKGETERLWLFFNPALAASAAAAVEARPARGWPLACQPLQLLLMALALPPLVRPY